MQKLMDELGIGTKEMVNYFGIHRNTMTRWRNVKGGISCPNHILRHLEFLVMMKREIDSLRGK